MDNSAIQRPLSTLLAVAVCTAYIPAVFAEAGVTAKEIVLGSCSALSGPAKGLGSETVLGAKAYLDYVNEQGGVHGRKIRLIAKDDGYEPDRAIVCFKELMAENVFALGFFVGTPTAAKHAPLATNGKIPLVGLFTGAQFLRDPLKHYVFNVRASYAAETSAQVNNLWETLGYRKIAVLYQDDAFGAAVLNGVKLALAAKKAEPAALGSFERNTTNVDAGIKQVRDANPEAVVLVGTYTNLAEIVKRSKAAGWNPLFLTVSFVGTEAFIEAAGSAAEGTVITQVVPPPSRADLPTVALYRRLVAKIGGKPGFVSLEGFVDAMVMVEGLKRAGKDLTREGLITALESIKNMDMGLGAQLKANYGPDDHEAFKQVYATVVRKDAATVFTDWTSVKK